MANWIARCNIADLLHNAEEGDLSVATAVSAKLLAFAKNKLATRRLDDYDRDELSGLAEDLGYAPDVEEADAVLEAIYDWADANLVWLGV